MTASREDESEFHPFFAVGAAPVSAYNTRIVQCN